MKKIALTKTLSLLLIFVLCISLAACRSGGSDSRQAGSGQNQTSDTQGEVQGGSG